MYFIKYSAMIRLNYRGNLVMKKVVSVSIGSSSRNKKGTVNLDGNTFEVERIGTDGSLFEAARMIRTLSKDSSVGAIGLGGVDLYVYAGNC